MRCLWLSTVFVLVSLGTGMAYDLIGFIEGETEGDQFGQAVAAVDFNADSFDDLVVSAPAADDAGTSSGKVYIYYGGPTADTIADLTLVGEASSFFGKAVSPAGDFNHDGYEDLLVGAPFYDLPASAAGAAYLFYGGPSPDTTVDHIFTGEAENDFFGVAVVGAGDFNNDTHADIAIGAYRADWGTFSKSGKVYVYFGGPAPDFQVDKVLVGEADGERFGYALTSGDFNGDTWADLAVGAYSYDGSALNQGRIYAFFGGVTPDTLADLRIGGDSAGYKFGWSLASGRLDEDVYDDLLMGTDGFAIDTFAAGKVFAFYGGPTLDTVADYEYTLGRLQNDYLGFDVAGGVDMNEDGFDELTAGMPGNDDPATEAGGAILFRGGATVSPDTSVFGTDAGEEMGEAVGFWRGYGGAHTHVLVVGASAYSSYRGRVLLLSEANPVPNNPPILDSIGPRTIEAGATLTFDISASDPDTGIPSLDAFDLPPGAQFMDNEDGTGHFEWLPALADTGLHMVLFVADDGELSDSELVEITVLDSADCCQNRGNVDGLFEGSFATTVSDLTYLVAYLFSGGPPPPCQEEGNVDGEGTAESPIDVADVTYLVAYLFAGGAPPPACS